MDRMPVPGDPVPYSFTAMPGRCLRLIYSPQLQTTHCHEPPAWRGIWKDRKGKSWYVEACLEHAPKVSWRVGALTRKLSKGRARTEP